MPPRADIHTDGLHAAAAAADAASTGGFIYEDAGVFTGAANEWHTLRPRVMANLQLPAGQARTIQAKINIPSNPAQSSHIINPGVDATHRWFIRVTTTGSADLGLSTGVPFLVVASAAAAVPTGVDTVITVTRNASNLWTLYVDGVSEDTATDATGVLPTDRIIIGDDGGNLGKFGPGTIKELAVFHEVVSNPAIIDPTNAKFYWAPEDPV